MSASAFSGPLVVYGAAPYATETNEDRGPSAFDQGMALLDPRTPFTYTPGISDTRKFYAHLASGIVCIDAVPSALSATNIAAAQAPTASVALTLVSSSGSGITVSTSITNASTGAAVTGLLAIDTAMTPVTFGSAAQTSVWDPTKAIARNIRITSVGDDSAATFSVVGYDLYGYPLVETITGANATVASGVKAFKYITSVTPAGTLSGSNVSVGTGDVIGLPLRADYFGHVRLVYNDAAITASTGFTAAVTSTATATTGDVRGTYALQTASNGTRRLIAYVHPSVANISSSTGLYGVSQYGG